MDDVERLIDQVLDGLETESELGRVRAYRLCVRWAEQYLSDDRSCNAFLYRAAERLGQAPMALPVIFNRVPLPDGAQACFYLQDDDAPVLVGNQAGLRYLAGLLAELAEAPVPGESIYLDPGLEPMIAESDGLMIYLEDEAWFEAALEGREDELAEAWEAELEARILNPEHIVAVQFEWPLALPLAISPRRIYRVLGISEVPEDTELPQKRLRTDRGRQRILTLLDDDEQVLPLVVDLDDPELTFYYPWHLEQFAAAFAPGDSNSAQVR